MPSVTLVCRQLYVEWIQYADSCMLWVSPVCWQLYAMSDSSTLTVVCYEWPQYVDSFLLWVTPISQHRCVYAVVLFLYRQYFCPWVSSTRFWKILRRRLSCRPAKSWHCLTDLFTNLCRWGYLQIDDLCRWGTFGVEYELVLFKDSNY